MADAQGITGTGSWTGGTFQTSGASNTSLSNSITFSNPTFTVNSGTMLSTGANTLTYDGALIYKQRHCKWPGQNNGFRRFARCGCNRI